MWHQGAAISDQRPCPWVPGRLDEGSPPGVHVYTIYVQYIYIYLVGGFNPSEKYESQLGLLFQIYGKIKNV